MEKATPSVGGGSLHRVPQMYTRLLSPMSMQMRLLDDLSDGNHESLLIPMMSSMLPTTGR
jgi:hypothetical protein